MANINSLTSNSYSSSSSIYGNRNVLTGLASGMDTEAMIENSVTGYQTKITELQQKQTKLEWKQDAYRELIDQMYSITSKYTSFSSETNLSSNAFFTGNASTIVSGSNASAVSASGKATSDIRINAVTSLATAARYTVDASALGVHISDEAVGGAIDWGKNLTKGTLSGTMSLKVGSSSVEIKFTDEDKYASLDELVAGINKKLSDQSADVKATLNNGEITFETTGSAKTKGDSVYISGASGNLKTMLNVTTATSTADEKRFDYKSFSLSGDASGLTKTLSMAEYFSGKTIDVTLDGMTKSIKIGDLSGIEQPDLSSYDAKIAEVNTKIDEVKNTEMSDEERAQKNTELFEELRVAQAERSNALNTSMTSALKDDLQASINKEFGTNRITVGSTNTGGLRFDVARGSGSTVKVVSSVGSELGISEAGVSNYFNTSQKLGSLLGEDWLNKNARIEGTLDHNATERYFDKDGNELKLSDGVYYRINSDGSIMTKDGEKVAGTRVSTLFTDTDGNLIKKYANEDTYYRVNAKGEWLYDLKINGVSIGDITKDTSMEGVLNKINSSDTAGVKVNYSTLTDQFVFTSRQTGAGSDVSIDGALAQKLFDVKQSPANTTLESLFGDTFDWDENGNMQLLMTKVPAGSYSLGKFNKNDSVETFMTKLNEAGNGAVQNWLSYDETAGKYVLGGGYENGQQGKVSFAAFFQPDKELSLEALVEKANAAAATRGGEKTKGEDAVIRATVNGKDLVLTRSNNVIDMDGLSVILKEKFSAYGEDEKLNEADALTFSTSSNSDKIVDTIKTFVEDVNKLMTDVHKAFTTQPATKTSSSSKKGVTYYEPLTEEDRNSMSESAVEKYEEKAKSGLLFGDSDLRSLYDKLVTAIQAYGTDRVDLESIGLSTAYSNGVTTLKLNETKLREALDSNPDKVRTVFTKTTEGGSTTNGLMQSLKMTLNDYASTSLAKPGILVSKAGTKLSAVSLLHNNLYQQIGNIDKQIESWQSKLSSRIDYYTKQFTALEKMMSTMNNQSSMLSDLMGY